MMKAGAALHQLFHASLNQRLGERVHRAGRLVHDEDLRLGQHRSRQTDQLLLTDRKQVAAFAHLFSIFLFQRRDEIVRADEPGSLFDSSSVASNRP